MFSQTVREPRLQGCVLGTFAAFALLTLGANNAALAITWDLVGTGDWNTAANWDPDGLPTASDTVNVNNGGTAQIGSEGAVANHLYIDGGSTIAFSGGATTTFTVEGSHSYVGNGSTGTFTQTGGAFSIGQQALYVGNNASGNGAYNISGGSLACYYIRVGQSGTGVFNHSGGTVTVNSQNLVVGRYSPANGTYNLSGTGVLTAPNEFVGCWGDQTGGTGVFNQSGGSNTIAGYLYLGSSTTTETTTGGTGTYTLSAGTLAVGGDIVDRGGTGGVSNFNIDGTTYTLTVSGGDIGVDNFAVGPTNNASFTQKADLTTTVNNNLSIGASGTTSTVNVTGGTLSVGGDITGGGDSRLYINAIETAYTLTVTGGDIGVDRFVVGSGSGSTGEFTLADGLKLTTDWQYIGDSGTGTLTQTGGTNQVTNGTGAIYLGNSASGNGTYNLSGGALVTNYV